MNADVDPKRTVKVTVVPGWGQDDARPGGCCAKSGGVNHKDHLLFACPGCGRRGSLRCTRPGDVGGRSWDIVSGTLADPAALTLSPSISCVGCCGWHGYLRNGVFESC